MKKILAFVTCLVLICIFSVTAFAQGATATLNGVPSEIKKDATATVTANVSGSPTLSSALVQVTLGDGLELVSGEWKKDGIMKDFTVSNGYGVLALASAGTLDGTVFSFVVKGKTISANAQNIKVDFTFKNGSANVGAASVTKTLKIVCANHNYGAWQKVNDTQHKHICSACGYTETANHTWNGGTVTKAATCKETGNKKYTCTACKAEKNETIAKTSSHSWSGYIVTKQPTCTESGIESGKCTRCGKETTSEIKATGHKFGAWADDKSATCTEGGTQKRVCSKCGAEEKRNTEPLGHDFENPTIVKEATISTTGLKEGKFKRCGQTTSEVIPCTARDEDTGILFETEEGVFAEGTKLTVEEIGKDNPTYESVKNILSGISDTFTVYGISAELIGAEVQPNGEVTVDFAIPDGYGNDVALYAITEDGQSEKIDADISDDGKTFSAKLNKFSTYAICKLGTSNTEANTSSGTDEISKPVDQPAQSGNTLWIVLAFVATLLVAGAITAVIVIKKKKINPNE